LRGATADLQPRTRVGRNVQGAFTIRPMSADVSQPYPIDTAFDVELADQLAYLESFNKHYYRPNTYLHKWWARRCGTSFRLILKHLVTDKALQDYYQPGWLNGRIILDPMMGGGTTLHEALRLGANVIGVDLDPIPVLQARATLTDMPLKQLEEAYKVFFAALKRDLSAFYRTSCPTCGDETESGYVLYGARRSCRCGEVVVVDSLVLRQEADGTLVR
jgi:putative DNA methylase